MESHASENRLVSGREAAAMLGLRPQTLAKWRMTGRHLPVVRLGRTIRYRLGDIERLIAEGSEVVQAG